MFRIHPLYCLVPMAIALGISPAKARENQALAHRIETESLVLEWTDSPDSTEVDAVTSEATRLYESISELLGERPQGKVTIVLGGPAERPGGQRDHPRVDSKGRILLFRFRPEFDSYLDALGHEMVHAFRFERRFSVDWFFEEGFAEFIELRVNPSMAGFPWFDFPVGLVAGQWLASGEGIPLSTLRERHNELNLGCRAQSYALRSAFFDWLGHAHGDRLVLEAAKSKSAGALTDYEKFFGKSFTELESDWRQSLLATYRAMPDVDAQAKRYRLESPIRYQKVCAPGKDF